MERDFTGQVSASLERRACWDGVLLAVEYSGFLVVLGGV